MPRLLAFYQDLWDDDGTALGWRPVAWGLRFADGSAISVNVEGKPSVTLWQSLDDAVEALDAYVDTPEPRTHYDRPLPPPPSPAGSSSTGSSAGRPRPTPVPVRVPEAPDVPGDDPPESSEPARSTG